MHKTSLEADVEATMRDGTVLRADVFRPDTSGKFPVILERTPYNKGADRFHEKGSKLAERGFLYVIQDVRGRYGSEGEFMPGFFSGDHMDDVDGYDTVEWAASLPWSTGRVGTTGGSYDGWTQLELAHTRPPHLNAIMPQLICANLLDRELSAVLRLGRVLWWSMNTLSPDQRVRDNAPTGPRTPDEAEDYFVNRDRGKWYWYLPLMEIPDEAMHGIGPHWRKWLSDHATDHFGFEAKHSSMVVPSLNQTGWYDQQGMSIKNFTGLRENAATALARDNQYLIVGPWTHDGTEWPTKLGDMDFGPEAHLDYYEITSQWYRRWLYGDEDAIADWPKVRIFVMGDNTWRDEDDWPLARTRYVPYYLHSGGGASSVSGDGMLSEEAPGDEAPDAYACDPRDPAMALHQQQ
ncbi:MAG: CocE/NonD family hydrolase, partial [Chloroflexi bacterium]|nr:CocE/NonD family hydrolase [Chloroflexota bacterium]